MLGLVCHMSRGRPPAGPLWWEAGRRAHLAAGAFL